MARGLREKIPPVSASSLALAIGKGFVEIAPPSRSRARGQNFSRTILCSTCSR